MPAKSKLRKRFEDHPNARSAAIYDDPPGRDEISAMVRSAGLTSLSPDGEAALDALAQTLDPGDFRQTVEKLALYCLDSTEPAGAESVAAIAPVESNATLPM